jgi:hypothetical protein
MPPNPYRKQHAVEQKFVRVELAERWCAVASRAALLLLTVGLGATTIICALRGSAWALTTGAGSSSVIAGTAARFERRYFAVD